MDYKEQFRALLAQIEQDGQRGLIPLLISDVLAERYDDNMMRWCEYHIASKRLQMASIGSEHKQTLCDCENL